MKVALTKFEFGNSHGIYKITVTRTANNDFEKFS